MSSVRQSGTIVKWDDEKGFGFIAPDAGAGDVFAHVKVVVSARRPTVGDRVFFFPSKDNQGRWRAIQIQFENRSVWSRDLRGCRRRVIRSAHDHAWSWSAFSVAFAGAFLAALTLAAWIGRVAPVFPVVYAMMSTVTIAAYWHDKTSARHGVQRLPENALHLLELFGGWPGALVAQQWFRHKTRKLSFQFVFWAIVAAHFGAWIYLTPRK